MIPTTEERRRVCAFYCRELLGHALEWAATRDESAIVLAVMACERIAILSSERTRVWN